MIQENSEVPLFALIDCNNFYASCERVFAPCLTGKPIVILSNNDGCIIARSNEAKELGIPMGAPYFKYRDIIKKNQVHVFSSNYELYGDMSCRVMNTIKHFAKNVEIYSIDEAFVSLSYLAPEEVEEYISNLRAQIQKWTGITVSIGVGSSKTLAKIANHIAKKKIKEGIFYLKNLEQQEKILSTLKVEEIWGISKGWGDKLRNIGITTAIQLKNSDPKMIRSKFSVIMAKIVLELRGISCIGVTPSAPTQNIISSRSFGRAVTQLEELEEAVANYVYNACIKLRKQGSKAQGIYVFLKTSKYKMLDLADNYSFKAEEKFHHGSSDTCFITTIAKECLAKIFVSGTPYTKAGIILLDCKDATHQQESFFDSDKKQEQDNIMQIVDLINIKLGKGTIFFASQGTKREWAMKREQKSPSYTTKWEEILVVAA